MNANHDPYSGWGRVLTASGDRYRPEKLAALGAGMDATPGPAIGALRSYGDAALNDARPAYDMSRLDRLIAFDPDTGVLEAEGGVSLSDITSVFGPRGWLPAVLPGTGFVTLGGAIAGDVHGKNHHDAGSFASHVLSISLMGANGTVEQVTPEGTPDLFRATAGGMGQTGIIVAARIQLSPCPSTFMDVRERRMAGLAAFLEAFETSEATFSVGWIDATAKGGELGRGIMEEAEFTTRPAPFAKPAGSRPVPFNAPSFALAPPIVRLFNAAYLRRVPVGGRDRTRPLHAFFHPLDRLTGWNKLYGKRGFHQFQCVLPPDSAATTLDQMLREIATAGISSPLSVLKKMGAGRAGHLSFPMEGYTLAVDFPNSDRAGPLLAKLEGMTRSAGGRIYLAKDSSMGAEGLGAMYPELDDWREVVNRADPGGQFETDLSRRLNLRGLA